MHVSSLTEERSIVERRLDGNHFYQSTISVQILVFHWWFIYSVRRTTTSFQENVIFSANMTIMGNLHVGGNLAGWLSVLVHRLCKEKLCWIKYLGYCIPCARYGYIYIWLLQPYSPLWPISAIIYNVLCSKADYEICEWKDIFNRILIERVTIFRRIYIWYFFAFDNLYIVLRRIVFVWWAYWSYI